MKHVNLRLPDDLHAALAKAAQVDERSLNSEVIWLLRRSLDAGSPGGDSPTTAPLRGKPHSPPA
jgi:hypothetical protein